MQSEKMNTLKVKMYIIIIINEQRSKHSKNEINNEFQPARKIRQNTRETIK